VETNCSATQNDYGWLGAAAGAGASDALGIYWKIEKVVRKLESASGSVVGVTGAIYAIRRELYVEIPQGTILDDVFVPMNVARMGKRVVFQSSAIARDRIFSKKGKEFARKVRTLSGNYQLLQLAPWILSRSNPIRFEFVSHKLLRLVVPFALAVLLAASFGLNSPFYRVILILQLVFYALSVLALTRLVRGGVVARFADAAGTFVLLNGAAVVALANFVSGRRTAWTR